MRTPSPAAPSGGGTAGRRGRLAAALAAALTAGCGGGGGGGGGAAPVDIAALTARIDRGDPELPAAAGYTGSAACVTCHADVFRLHERTGHHRGLRATDRPGVSGARVHADLDGRGRDDFRTGLDLASTEAFRTLGTGAPRLSFAAGEPLPYRVTLGGATFAVERVYGGRRSEAYLLRVGAHLLPAPFEFDVARRAYVAGDLDPWYVDGAPRFASAEAAAAGMDAAAAFERRCAGCHVTGLRVEFGGGRWRTGFAEMDVGCESCHGPGADHVLSQGDPARILNPRDLDDGTPEGRRRADAVCGQCHVRGTGGTPRLAPAPVEYPWSATEGPFRPGDALDAFLAPSTDPADHWGFRDNPTGGTPTPPLTGDDAFLAARGGWMQGREHAAGGHSPDRPGAPLCIDCHDPHERRGASQLRTRSAARPGVPVSAADGTLCLDCHAGRAPFASLVPGDLSPDGTREAVALHLAAAAMPVPPSSVDPAGTGVGSCVACHMPSTVTDRRAAGTDGAGFVRGGPGGGTHMMTVLWPSASEAHGVTNGCNACHPTTGTDPVARVLADWRRDGGDGDGVHHAAPPGPFQGGRLGSAAGAGAACVRCHTAEGFRTVVVDGDPAGMEEDAEARRAILDRAVRREEGLTCVACHGADGSPSPGTAPALRVPRDRLCAACHGDGVTLDDYLATGQAPHAPQQGFLDGTAGAEPPGGAPFLRGFHASITDACVQCHRGGEPPAPARHSFEPSLDTCRRCHPTPSSFDLVAFGDYDGDGTVEGLQTEVTGLLDLLRAAVLAADPEVTHDGERFRRGGAAGTAGASDAVRRAAFNWESVFRDGSRGLHDPPRIVALLQRSHREVAGFDVPGATLR